MGREIDFWTPTPHLKTTNIFLSQTKNHQKEIYKENLGAYPPFNFFLCLLVESSFECQCQCQAGASYIYKLLCDQLYIFIKYFT